MRESHRVFFLQIPLDALPLPYIFYNSLRFATTKSWRKSSLVRKIVSTILMGFHCEEGFEHGNCSVILTRRGCCCDLGVQPLYSRRKDPVTHYPVVFNPISRYFSHFQDPYRTLSHSYRDDFRGYACLRLSDWATQVHTICLRRRFSRNARIQYLVKIDNSLHEICNAAMTLARFLENPNFHIRSSPLVIYSSRKPHAKGL